MTEKFDKYWKDIKGPMGIAINLDPCFKSECLFGFFESLLGQSTNVCMEKVHDVKNLYVI